VALVSQHALLNEAGLDRPGRRQHVDALRRGYLAEHGASSELEQTLSRLYRKHRPEVERLLSGEHPLAQRLGPPLARRAARTKAAFAGLRALEAQGRLCQRPEEVLKSVAHLCANRLLRSASRLQELVLNDFLDRAYRTEAGKARQRGPPQTSG
jgi:hypothetical protein